MDDKIIKSMCARKQKVEEIVIVKKKKHRVVFYR